MQHEPGHAASVPAVTPDPVRFCGGLAPASGHGSSWSPRHPSRQPRQQQHQHAGPGEHDAQQRQRHGRVVGRRLSALASIALSCPRAIRCGGRRPPRAGRRRPGIGSSPRVACRGIGRGASTACACAGHIGRTSAARGAGLPTMPRGRLRVAIISASWRCPALGSGRAASPGSASVGAGVPVRTASTGAAHRRSGRGLRLQRAPGSTGPTTTSTIPMARLAPASGRRTVPRGEASHRPRRSRTPPRAAGGLGRGQPEVAWPRGHERDRGRDATDGGDVRGERGALAAAAEQGARRSAASAAVRSVVVGCGTDHEPAVVLGMVGGRSGFRGSRRSDAHRRPIGSRSATEMLHLVREQVAERQPPAVDARLDGAQRDTGHLGDLVVVVALDVVQHDGGALVLRDLAERDGDGPAAAAGDGRLLRTFRLRRWAAARSRPPTPGTGRQVDACGPAARRSRR